MIRSMTGYGRGEYSDKKGTIIVEIKSLNHRFLETVFRLPESLVLFEERIREMIQHKAKRGRINLSLFFERFKKETALICVDKDLAKRYHKALISLKKDLRLKDDIGVNQIVSFPNVLKFELPQEDLSELRHSIERALNKALDSLVESRIKEGKILYADLAKRVKELFGLLINIERRQPQVIKEYKKRLPKRISGITVSTVLSRERLEEEVLSFAKNTDITEELVRVRGHLKSFQKRMQLKGPVGKELDFLAQELHREANTICSKVADYRISEWVIKMKSEIEKIREQLQNVE